MPLSEDFGIAARGSPSPTPRKRQPPFGLRLTVEERERLEREAAGLPLAPTSSRGCWERQCSAGRAAAGCRLPIAKPMPRRWTDRAKPRPCGAAAGDRAPREGRLASRPLRMVPDRCQHPHHPTASARWRPDHHTTCPRHECRTSYVGRHLVVPLQRRHQTSSAPR